MVEQWKELHQFPGYKISSKGRLFSCAKKNAHLGGFRYSKKRMLKQRPDHKGYLWSGITVNGQSNHVTIHRAVAIAFIPNPENKPQVNHINCIKTDNRVENLEWCTNQENRNHAVKNNLVPKGERHHYNKFTKDIAQKIIQLHGMDVDRRSVAKELGVSPGTLSRWILKHNLNIRFRSHRYG